MPLPQDTDNFRREVGLDKLGIGIRQTHILKGVVAAPDQFQFVAHDHISLKRFRRSRITSISGFGVLMPWVDFFWKAWITHTSSPICTAYTARYALPREGNAISNTPLPS